MNSYTSWTFCRNKWIIPSNCLWIFDLKQPTEAACSSASAIDQCHLSSTPYPTPSLKAKEKLAKNGSVCRNVGAEFKMSNLCDLCDSKTHITYVQHFSVIFYEMFTFDQIYAEKLVQILLIRLLGFIWCMLAFRQEDLCFRAKNWQIFSYRNVNASDLGQFTIHQRKGETNKKQDYWICYPNWYPFSFQCHVKFYSMKR